MRRVTLQRLGILIGCVTVGAIAGFLVARITSDSPSTSSTFPVAGGALLLLIAASAAVRRRKDKSQNKASEDIGAGAPNPQR